MAWFKPKSQRPSNQPVSIIICAKNEADNLTKNLPAILSQSYSNFEVVLINDSSSDRTLKVMKAFQKKNDNIKIVDVKAVEAFWGNKKYALTLGIKAATHDHLLFTDADCKPSSNHWISSICSKFEQNKTLVIGYSPYDKIKGSFLNILIRFETFMTAMQYFSYAKIGQPYMAVGRNLAYKKSLFFEANGFINHIKIKSGDDDLFVNQMATKTNTAISLEKESFIYSSPKKSFKSWRIQKRRHISTAAFYKTKHKVMLALFYISQFLFLLLAISLLALAFKWEIVLTLCLLRFIVQYSVLYPATKTLEEKDLLWYLPIVEFFLIVFQFSIFIQNLISKPQHWK